MKRSLLAAAVVSLVLSPIALAAQAPSDSPSRAGLALERPAVEALPAAVDVVPDQLEAIARFNRSGSTMAKNGFTRELSRERAVRLSTADLGRPTPFPLAGGTVTRSARGGLVWTGEEKHYTLAGAGPGANELPGLFDRDGFDP